MSFIVTTKPKFLAPVLARVPADNGQFTRVKFSVLFKALPKPEVDELLKQIRDRAAAMADDPTATPLTDREVIDQVLVGFGEDLLEEDRTPMAYNPANVDRLCAIWPLEGAIVKSFFDNYITGATKN